ncbi:MAG: DUF1917 domain-containing protein [Methanocorpusculum sp.]|nr:DUF1917 domain-containing protein [Methanocorpusculum sp.]
MNDETEEQIIEEIDDEFTPEELTDLAFGMFSIFVEQHLEKKGKYLFKCVEENKDLKDVCEKLMKEFTSEYPSLEEPLKLNGGAEEIAILYSLGEGSVPSMTIKSYWIQQGKPGVSPTLCGAEEAGKWLIFVAPEEVDDLWKKIRSATINGELGIGAKVSTAKDNEDSRDDRKVIYVFTENWEDEAEIMRVREVLKTLGVKDRIGYKRNMDTYAGEYREKGKRVTYYSV